MRLAAGIAVASLAACASTPPLHHDLVVEGRAQNYAAFEVAAYECGFTSLKEVSDGSGGSHINLYNVYPLTRASQCATRWVEEHPELGLRVSAH
jgi:hypothetical protein